MSQPLSSKNARNQQEDLDPERDKPDGITREQFKAINREPSLYPQLELENQRRAISTTLKAKPTKQILNPMLADPRQRAKENNAGKDKPGDHQQAFNENSANNIRLTTKKRRRQAARDLRVGAARSHSRMGTKEMETEDEVFNAEPKTKNQFEDTMTGDGVMMAAPTIQEKHNDEDMGLRGQIPKAHQLLQPSHPSQLPNFPYSMPKPRTDGSGKPAAKKDKLERKKERNINNAMGKEGVLSEDPPSWLLWRHDPNPRSQLPQLPPITPESRPTMSHKQDNMSAQYCTSGCIHNTFFHDRSQNDWSIDGSYELVCKAQDVRLKHWLYCLTK